MSMEHAPEQDGSLNEILNRLIKLISRRFQVAEVHISLVDFNKDWLLLRAGLEVPVSAVTIPMQCTMPCLPNVTVIEDTQMHPTYRMHRYPTSSVGIEGSLRFYSETSLTIEGTKVGRVCIADVHPRHDFCLDQQTMFVALADTISGLIADKWAHEQEEHYNGIYFHELMLDVLKDVVGKLIETKGRIRSLFLLAKKEYKENGASSKFSELLTSLRLVTQTFQREQTFLNHFYDAQRKLDIDEKIPLDGHQQLQKLEIGIDRDQIFTFPFSTDDWKRSLQTVADYYGSLSMPMHFESRLENGDFRITSHPDVLSLCISALFGHLYAAFDQSHNVIGNGDAAATSATMERMVRNSKGTASSSNGMTMIRVGTSLTKQLPNGAPRHLCLQITSSLAIPPIFNAMQHALDTLVQQYLCGRCRFVTEFSFQILVPLLPVESANGPRNNIPSAVQRACVSNLSVTGGGYIRKIEPSSLTSSAHRSIPALNSIAHQISSVVTPSCVLGTAGHQLISQGAHSMRTPVSGTRYDAQPSALSTTVVPAAKEVICASSPTRDVEPVASVAGAEGNRSRSSLRGMAQQLVDTCKHFIALTPTGSTSFLLVQPSTQTLTHSHTHVEAGVQKADNEYSIATTRMESSGSFDQSEFKTPNSPAGNSAQSPKQLSGVKTSLLTAMAVSSHNKVAPANGLDVDSTLQPVSTTTITSALSHMLIGHAHHKVLPALD